jgi:hypothetical protein
MGYGRWKKCPKQYTNHYLRREHTRSMAWYATELYPLVQEHLRFSYNEKPVSFKDWVLRLV